MTTAELITRFPELANEDVARLQMAIDDAELMVGECFGKFRTLAVALLSAHNFIVGKESANGNTSALKEVVSESVGGVSVSYAVSSDGNDTYGSTTYGQQFEILKKRACTGAVLIG